MKPPAKLTVEMNSLFPRYACYVTDGVGTENGGFLRRFRTHSAMFAWLASHGYAFQSATANREG